MPKKKKTRKQKMQLDQKRQMPHEIKPSTHTAPKTDDSGTQRHEADQESISFSLPTSYTTKEVSHPATKPTTTTIATHEYTYLGRDLLKTGFLTGAIILAEIALKFLFRG